MEWTARHDILLCREMLVEEPFKHRKGSNERGKGWTNIANNVNNLEEKKFKVSQRGVRERFERLQKRYLDKMKMEAAASGISPPEETELDVLPEEITERENVAEGSRDSEKGMKKAQAERKTAEAMRREAMETFGETRKRCQDQDQQEKTPKRKRRSGGDAVDFLRERSEEDLRLRAEELEVRKKQQQLEDEKQDKVLKRQSNMMEVMQNMQLAMFQQQQQQNAAMMALIQKLTDKSS